MQEGRKIGIEASYINKEYGGGKEQVLLNLLRGLKDLGYLDQVVVFGNKEAEGKFLKIDKDINFVALEFFRKKISRMRLLIFFRTFLFSSYVRKYDIDIILFPAYFVGFRRFKVPVISIPHDIQFKSNPNVYKEIPHNVLNFLYGSGFRRSDKIIAISEFDKDDISKHFPDCADKIVRIYNPIIFNENNNEASKDPAAKKNSPIKKSEKKYIFANNLSYEHKNLKTLLQAFNKIRKDLNYNLHISGKLWIGDEETQELINILIEDQRLVLYNYLAREDFNRVLARADLFVNPSSFEGFGMSAVEAMFAKVPCVLADNSAVKEVTKGLADYYSPARDVDVLAEAMLTALKKEKNEQLLEEAKAAVNRSYDYKIIAGEYMRLFNEAYGD